MSRRGTGDVTEGPAGRDEGENEPGAPATDARWSPDLTAPEETALDETALDESLLAETVAGAPVPDAAAADRALAPQRRRTDAWRWAGRGRLTVSREEAGPDWAADPGRAAELGGRLFGWLTVVPVLTVTAWLLPALPLLLAHRFLPVPMFLIAAPVAAYLAVVSARYLPGRWPAPARQPGPDHPWVAWWAAAGTAAVAAGFGLWQAALNSPQLIVTRTPGVLTQLGYWIAQRGSLSVPVTAAAFGGAHPGLGFASYGFAVHGASLMSWQPPGLPAVLAAGAWLHGLAGMTAVSPVLAGLAVLAVGGLTGRLAGLAWAPAGALAAALTLPQLVTGRSAYPEPLAELLLFGGLCLVVDSLAVRGSGKRGRVPAGLTRWPAAPGGAAALAGLGGLALGLTPLVLAGRLLVLLPAIPFAAALIRRDRWRGSSFGVGVVIGLGYGLAGGLLLTAPGRGVLAPLLRMAVPGVIAAVVVTLAGMAGGFRGHGRGRRRWAVRPRRWAVRWLPEAVAVGVVAAAAGLMARPYLQHVRGGPGGGYVGFLQRLAGLPVDPRRLYAEDSLYWVVWYLGLPAVLLGVAGLALLARRCTRSVLSQQDPAGDRLMQALPLLIIGWGSAVVLWQPGTVPDQPWASRTLVTLVLPGLVVCGIWVAARLVTWGRERGAGMLAVTLAGTCFTAAVAVPGAVTSFGAGAAPAVSGTRLAVAGLTLSGPAGQRTGAGERAAVSRLCGTVGLESSVVIVDRVAAREFAPVLRMMCGIPAGVMVGASRAQVLAVARDIARLGRRPVLLASSRSGLVRYGTAPRRVLDLTDRQDAHLLTSPPEGTWAVRYQVWLSSPVPIAGT